jgi:large subunit ribosomal protein L2
MAVIKMKPTSPGRRGVVRISRDHLHKGAPHAALLEPQFQHAGRNNNGHITTRHKGGGHKHHYRVVDFRRIKDAIPAKVERIEYDPNRSAHIALVCYADGERQYIIAPRGLEVGASIMSGPEAPIRVGNTLPGEVRKIHIDCRATLGQVANEEHSLRRLGKAGAKRWKGIRPTVRGVVMNPVDHPHGGGEGKTGEGRHAVDPWGNLTKGYRTRNNKRTQVMIVSRRKK